MQLNLRPDSRDSLKDFRSVFVEYRSGFAIKQLGDQLPARQIVPELTTSIRAMVSIRLQSSLIRFRRQSIRPRAIRNITMLRISPIRSCISMHILTVRLTLALAVLTMGLGLRSASGLEWMYVSLGNNTIVRYDVSLTTGAAVQASANVFVSSGQGLNSPGSLAFDTSGNLYAANVGNNTITRYDSSGIYGGTPFVTSSQGLSGPSGLAFDTSGNLYAANVGNSTITRYDSSGNYGGTPFVTSSQGLSGPSGLAFDTSGNLYAANAGNSTITRYDSSGNYGGTPFVTSSQGLSGPLGLAFDTAGNLYASNNVGNSITRYDSSGNRIGTYFVSSNQGLRNPNGLAFDTTGSLYVSNPGNNTISKYDSAGVLQFSWSTTWQPRLLAFPTVVPEPSTYVLGGLATGVIALIARRRKSNRNGSDAFARSA
jgi:sugar lactone lactonase YvrE